MQKDLQKDFAKQVENKKFLGFIVFACFVFACLLCFCLLACLLACFTEKLVFKKLVFFHKFKLGKNEEQKKKKTK
jgi:hypothetical protein